MELVAPGALYLDGLVDAIERGWSYSRAEGDSTQADLERINTDRARFIEESADWSTAGPPITLPDGRVVERLPQAERWLWDGELCGRISLRMQPGTVDLPPYVLGHIGYTVVPWKQRRGYATQALRQMLPLARAQGLPYVELTTRPDNVPSQRVILANGGYLVEEFLTDPSDGARPQYRYRIDL